MNELIVVTKDHREIKTDKLSGLDIEWLGKDSYVKIYEPFVINKCFFQVGDNGHIEIQENSNMFELYIRMAAANSKVEIGNNFITSTAKFILARGGSNNSIIIGNNCLFSYNISILTSDEHSVFDVNTKKLLNNSGGNIVVSDHCWLGNDVCLTKRAKLPQDTICATKSLINKEFLEKNTMLAGIPAKIIKKFVSWDIKHPNEYMREV